ncbi:hypothetical protein BC830DRAFT_1164051 [Chytriomyces sp. MP71]|nr:hypothetical protein BC830DRAFT_1164051 [Chytriomyces sp. MP71]
MPYSAFGHLRNSRPLPLTLLSETKLPTLPRVPLTYASTDSGIQLKFKQPAPPQPAPAEQQFHHPTPKLIIKPILRIPAESGDAPTAPAPTDPRHSAVSADDIVDAAMDMEPRAQETYDDTDADDAADAQAPKRRLSQMGVSSSNGLGVEQPHQPKKKKEKAVGPRLPLASNGGGDDLGLPQHELNKVLLKLTTAVKQYMGPDGRNLAALFLSLPSKAMYPDYYILIKHPIALNIMQAKINGSKYSCIADLKAEMKLMVDNAKTYNAPDSLIYHDAETLWNVFNSEVAKVKKQYGKGDSTDSPSFKLKLKPEAPKEMVGNRDGKPIPKKEIDTLFRAIEDNNVKGFERAIHQVKINVDQMHKAKIDGMEFEWAPLHAVSYYGRAKMLDILVGQKANMEIRDTLHGSTPLMWAAYAGKVNTARRLMRNNRPDKFAKNNEGQTAMDLVSDPQNPEWRGILNNETPVLPLDKTFSGMGGLGLISDSGKRDRRVSKLPVPEGESPGQSFQKITYVGDMSLPDASNHLNRASNLRSQVKDTTPMVRPTMPVDLNKVPKWAKLPNTKDPNHLFCAAGSKEMAVIVEAPPIKDIEIPLPDENLNIFLSPGLKTMRANSVTVDKKVTKLPIRFYLANGNRGVYYSIQVYQNRTPLLPVLINGGTEDSDEFEPTVVEVTANLWEGINVFDVIVFLCRKAEPKGAAAVAAAEDGNVAEDYVGIQKKGHHAFQKSMLIVHRG